MGDEIVLSIAETNRLRASIGLPLIPDPDEKGTTKVEKKSATEGSKTHTELLVEETNKLRISVGLQPIPVDTERNGIEADVKEKARPNKVQEAVVKRRKPVKILWEEEEAEKKSTADWLSNLGEVKDVENEQNSEKNTAAVVDGVTIAHSAKQLQDIGENAIFTLKDTDILGDEADNDELDNQQLNMKAKLKKELKEKQEADSLKFNGRSIEENDEEEEEDKERVLITDSNIVIPKAHVEEEQIEKQGKLQIASLFDNDDDELDGGDNGLSNDYSRPRKPIKMKKIKKNSLLKSREAKFVDDTIELKTVKLEADDDFGDDGDLQKIIDAKRKQKQKGLRSKLTAEQIAQEVKQFELWDRANEIEARTQTGGLVLNDTVDFLNTLNKSIITENKPVEQGDAYIKQEEEEAYINIKAGKEDIYIKQENAEDNREDAIIKKEEDESLVKQEERAITQEADQETDAGPKFNGGLAATLKFLQSRNIIDKITPETQKSAKQQREAVKEADLLKLQISIEERHVREELESLKQFMSLPRDQREVQIQALVDQRLQKKGMVPKANNKKRTKYNTDDKLNNYNPQVKLSYRDESGQELNTKQAFKFLSHKFHGVGPNKKMKKAGEEPSSGSRII